jgi:hypothetical protein
MATYEPTLHTGVTDTLTWAITFEYARVTDLQVLVEGVEIDLGTADDEWRPSSNGLLIVFVDGFEPQTGESIEIRRVTDISAPVVDWTAGSGFTEIDADLMVSQLIKAIDELQVPAFEHTFTLAELDAGDLSTPHNLGATPTRVEYILKCTTTDQAYGENNEIPLLGCNDVPALLWTSSVLATFSDEWDTIDAHKGTVAGRGVLNVDKWSLIVRAWR